MEGTQELAHVQFAGAPSFLSPSSLGGIPAEIVQQYEDNLRWLDGAGRNKLVVGSQARILYSDQEGRAAITKAFNEAVASGEVSAPIVISRDHHDVSGTDSPFRETSNIKDGSAFTVRKGLRLADKFHYLCLHCHH